MNWTFVSPFYQMGGFASFSYVSGLYRGQGRGCGGQWAVYWLSNVDYANSTPCILSIGDIIPIISQQQPA